MAPAEQYKFMIGITIANDVNERLFVGDQEPLFLFGASTRLPFFSSIVSTAPRGAVIGEAIGGRFRCFQVGYGDLVPRHPFSCTSVRRWHVR